MDRRLAKLYRERMDWQYLRERTSRVPEEADALRRIEQEIAH